MSHNSKTIDYFYTEFRANNIEKIFNVISPAFAYYVNGGPRLSYDVLAERLKLANQGAKVIGGKMTAEDDTHFSAEFEVQVADDKGEIISAFGFVEAQVRNGLIENLNVHYHKSAMDIDEFRELIKNNAMTFV